MKTMRLLLVELDLAVVYLHVVHLLMGALLGCLLSFPYLASYHLDDMEFDGFHAFPVQVH